MNAADTARSAASRASRGRHYGAVFSFLPHCKESRIAENLPMSKSRAINELAWVRSGSARTSVDSAAVAGAEQQEARLFASSRASRPGAVWPSRRRLNLATIQLGFVGAHIRRALLLPEGG